MDVESASSDNPLNIERRTVQEDGDGYETASSNAPDDYVQPPEHLTAEQVQQVQGIPKRAWKCFTKYLYRIVKCLGATNINLVYFIIVLATGAVMSLSVALKKPYGINESYIHYFFVLCMGIAIIWMLGACSCRKPPCGCCLEVRKAATRIPCYMIIGLTIFCLGSCFITGVDFLSFLYSTSCSNIDKAETKVMASEGIFDLVKLIFLILQLHFFCRFSDVNFYRRCCTSFFILHIIAVNLSTWFYFIVDESVDHMSSNYTNCSALSNIDNFVLKADVYLYPFNIEYTVMSSVLLLLMWFELRKRKTGNRMNHGERAEISCLSRVKNCLAEMCHCRQPIADADLRNDPKTMFFWKSAIIGYTVGILILTAYLVLIVLSAIEYEKSVKVYYGVRIALFALMFLASIFGLAFLPKPGRGSQAKLHTRVDSILIMIGVTGCYLMVLFQGISAISIDQRFSCGNRTTHFSSLSDKDNWTKFCPSMTVFIADNVVALFQFSLQAIFIVKALRRGHNEVLLASPISLAVVRNVSALLSLGNFGIWVMDTFELKDIKTVGAIEDFAYGNVWKILVHIAYPLCIFFRLHSAFCFFEIVINRFGVTAQHRRLGPYLPIRNRRQRTGSGSVYF